MVGLFVLLKRSRAPHALHFYFVCLTSFVFYAFQETGKFNPFDWTIFWCDLAASLLLPPLFLHFCLEFPVRNKWIKRPSRLLYLIYLPGALLLLAPDGVHQRRDQRCARRRSCCATCSTISATSHFAFVFRSERGRFASDVSYGANAGTASADEMGDARNRTGSCALLCAADRFRGCPASIPEAYVDFAIFPLVLIPISFGYAIHRYRLMDVDIIFKRASPIRWPRRA